MLIRQVTETGEIPLPLEWLNELGIELDSDVIMEKENDKVIIRALRER